MYRKIWKVGFFQAIRAALGKSTPAGEKKNLALQALRKLINGDVRSQSRSNVVQGKAFTERLEAAIARYHTNAITTVQVSRR